MTPFFVNSAYTQLRELEGLPPPLSISLCHALSAAVFAKQKLLQEKFLPQETVTWSIKSSLINPQLLTQAIETCSLIQPFSPPHFWLTQNRSAVDKAAIILLWPEKTKGQIGRVKCAQSWSEMSSFLEI